VLLWVALGMAVSATCLGAVGLVIGNNNLISFVLAVVLLAVFGMLWGVMQPVRNAYINEYIPSAERATVLSFDSFFSDIGAVVGQLGLGYGAQVASKALAYTVGGGIYFVAAPLYRLAGKASNRHPGSGGDEGTT
jgi:MFS family permease